MVKRMNIKKYYSIIGYLFAFLTLVLFWQAIVFYFQLPDYILPTPITVIKKIIAIFPVLMQQTWPTFLETILGLILGCTIGFCSALFLLFFKPLRFWLLPLLIISQALPTFAIAPLFVLWFGYGITAKILITMLMVFFPITSNLYDGLKNTPNGYLDLAYVMGAKRFALVRHIRLPAAMPHFASGMRLAAAYAPMGAIVGEWVGANQGLGYFILDANARMQIDAMFSGLIVLVIMTLVLYYSIDFILRRWIDW